MKLGSSDRWSLVNSSIEEFFNLARCPRIRNKNLKNISIFKLQIWSNAVLTTIAAPTISNFFSFQIFWPSSVRLAPYSFSSNLLLDFYVTSYWIVNHKWQIEKIRLRTPKNFILYRAPNLNHPRLRVSNIFTCLFTCLRAVSYWHEELYSTSIIVQSPRIFSLRKFLPFSLSLCYSFSYLDWQKIILYFSDIFPSRHTVQYRWQILHGRANNIYLHGGQDLRII